MQSQDNSIVSFIHLNDAYNLEADQKTGKKGMANMEAFIRRKRAQHPHNILLHSGDAFSPSLLNRITKDGQKGKYMVECLNQLHLDAACMGNHEFDLKDEDDNGEDDTLTRFKECNFPWLMGNILVKSTKKPIGYGYNQRTHIIKEVNGKKIGIFGVGGQDWIPIMLNQYESEGGIQYKNSSIHSAQMCKLLREEEKCDLVVALTHVRMKEDIRIAQQVDGIDIILGGHDHGLECEFYNQTPIIKSKYDFQMLSIVKAFEKGASKNITFEGRRFDWYIQQFPVPIATKQQINQDLDAKIKKWWKKFKDEDFVIGETEQELILESDYIRTNQSNLGNFLSDLIRNYHEVDCAILNSGSIRYPKNVPPGQLWNSVFYSDFPQQMTVINISGRKLLEVLEHSVRSYPNETGSFLQVSGIKFTFDQTKKPRIQKVQINGEPLQLDRQNYTVAMSQFLKKGGDGYTVLKSCPSNCQKDQHIDLNTIVNSFFGVKDLNIDEQKITTNLMAQMKQKKMKIPFLVGKITSGINEVREWRKKLHSLVFGKNDKLRLFHIAEHVLVGAKVVNKKIHRLHHLRECIKVGENCKKYTVISPKIQGRIVRVTKE